MHVQSLIVSTLTQSTKSVLSVAHPTRSGHPWTMELWSVSIVRASTEGSVFKQVSWGLYRSICGPKSSWSNLSRAETKSSLISLRITIFMSLRTSKSGTKPRLLTTTDDATQHLLQAWLSTSPNPVMKKDARFSMATSLTRVIGLCKNRWSLTRMIT